LEFPGFLFYSLFVVVTPKVSSPGDDMDSGSRAPFPARGSVHHVSLGWIRSYLGSLILEHLVVFPWFPFIGDWSYALSRTGFLTEVSLPPPASLEPPPSLPASRVIFFLPRMGSVIPGGSSGRRRGHLIPFFFPPPPHLSRPEVYVPPLPMSDMPISLTFPKVPVEEQVYRLGPIACIVSFAAWDRALTSLAARKPPSPPPVSFFSFFFFVSVNMLEAPPVARLLIVLCFLLLVDRWSTPFVLLTFS